MLGTILTIFTILEQAVTGWQWVIQAKRYAESFGIAATERAHRQDIRERLNLMQFIYSDLEGTLQSEFVNTSYRLQDLRMIDVDQRREPYSSLAGAMGVEVRNDEVARARHQANQALRKYNRALFLGNAGIGKTTFLSRIVLSLTDKTDGAMRQQFFHRRWKPFPVFVPLKVLDNSHPCPIFTYILTNYRYFRGRRGTHRLMKLVKGSRLLLVLDGYDEIFISEAADSYVSRDIEAIIDGRPDRSLHDRLDSEMAELYYMMRRNTVWLSSRKDYYAANRLKCEARESWRTFREPDITCIELLGVSSRIDFVKRIFDKHRAASETYRARLSEDAFMAYVHRAFDEEMIAFTYNPLFLTTLCYVYVKKLDHEGNVPKGGFRTMRRIILQCVTLLLTDLDRYKVRNLQPRVARSLLEKRGLYVREKRAFLGYFAACVEADVRRVRRAFTKEEIVEEARRFFSARANRPSAREILRGLDRDDSGSIVNQLVKQELFVIVSMHDPMLYDFPHRRFREVLASTYLDTPERIQELLKDLHNPDQRELFVVLFAVTEHHADGLLHAILQDAGHSEVADYFVSLAAACIKARGNGYHATTILQPWLKNALDNGRLQNVPAALLPYTHASEDFLFWLRSSLARALDTNQTRQAHLVGAILYHLSPASFLGMVVDCLVEDTNRAEQLIDVLISTDSEAFNRLVEEHRDNPVFVRRIATGALVRNGVTGTETWWRRMCAVLPLVQIAHLMRVADTYSPHLSAKLLGFEGRPELTQPVPDGDGSKPVYIVAHGKLDELEVERGRRALRGVPEGIYFEVPPIPKLDHAGNDEVERRLETERRRITVRIAQEGNPATELERIAEVLARIHKAETEQTYRFVESHMTRTRDEWSEFLRLRGSVTGASA